MFERKANCWYLSYIITYVGICTNIYILFLAVINKCYEYTDEDRIWRITRTKSEKELCERHKHNTFLAHGKGGKKVHGCGNKCSCCERIKGSLSKRFLRNFFKLGLAYIQIFY